MRRPALLLGGVALLTASATIYAAMRTRPDTQSAEPAIAVDLAIAEPGVRDAIERAVALVRDTAGKASSWGTLGAVLSAHGFDDDARTAFLNAHAADPKTARWPYLAAWMTAGDRSARLPWLRAAAELAPDDGWISLVFGECLAECGDTLGATLEFRRWTSSVGPLGARALLGLASVSAREDDYAAAKEYLLKSLAQADRSDTRTLLAAVLGQLGERGSAAQQAAIAAALPPSVPWPDPHLEFVARHAVGPTAIARRVQYLLRAKRVDEAYATSAIAVSRYPDAGLLQLLRGRCLVERAEYELAEEALRRALVSGASGADAHFHLARALLGRGDWSAARAECETALSVHAADLDASLLLAEINYRAGDRAAAIDALRTALPSNPGSRSLLGRLAGLLAEEGRFAEALETAQDAAALAPDDGPAAALVARLTQLAESR